MNHEFWNEIGNLYFMNGAYEPAIHAYLRSIKLENTFGRSYNNLAMAYVQTGKYGDAIKLYRRSIELLSDENEKATTWNRLGILYRQIKEYGNALEAYQRADLIAPQADAEKSAKASLPLTVSMPEINLDSILAKGALAKQEISDLFDKGETPRLESTAGLGDENYSSRLLAPSARISDEWKPAYKGEIVLVKKVEAVDALPHSNPLPKVEDEGEIGNHLETADAPQYSAEYSLTDLLSPEERQMLETNIVKCLQATNKNPRSYIYWEDLGEAYKSAGRYAEAIQAFQQALVLNSSNSACHYRLGLVYAAERKEQDAVNSFLKVLELDPNSAQAHASLASQYRKMGLDELAQKHIENARALQAEDESEYNRACLEAICGNHERALELLGTALQSKQTFITWAQSDPDFDALRQDCRFQALLSTHAVAVCA